MLNNVLALAIIVASIIGVWGNVSNGVRLALIGVIGAICVFVAAVSAQASDFGPAMGIGGFVITLLIFFVYNRTRG